MKYFMLPEARHVKVVARGVCWPGDDSIQQSLLQKKKKRQIESERCKTARNWPKTFTVYSHMIRHFYLFSSLSGVA